MQSIDYLIEENKGLVFRQLHKFYLTGDPEAESIAYWSLYTAINTFDKEKGYQLSTYASSVIYNALGDYVRKLHRKRRIDEVSYNAKCSEDCEYLEILSTGKLLEDEIVRQELVHKTKEAIASIVDKTTNQNHKRIILIYVENEYNISATDISKMLLVSQSYVSQALAEFKCKLKKKMEEYYYV